MTPELNSFLRRGMMLPHDAVGRLCMKGGIYTGEHCPVCDRTFQRLDHDLICPEHHTRPRKVFIQLYSKQLHQRIHIFLNQRGEALSFDEADRLLTVIRAEIDRIGDFDPSRYVKEKLKPYLFVNRSKEWLTTKQLEMEKGLKAPGYLSALRVYVAKMQDHFSEIDIREIHKVEIERFYLALKGAPHYVKNILDCLKQILQDALDNRIIPEVPKFPKIDVPETEIKTIDLDEQDKIINSIANPMDRAFILCTAREMIRPSETRGLQWDDFDLKHDRLIVRRHFSRSTIRPATKAKQIKVLPLDAEVKRTIQALPRHLTSAFVFWKGKTGKAFSEPWARKVWKIYALKAGIDVSLYQGTRHSSATEAVQRVGVDSVQEFLHHTNRAMTKRYAKVSPEGLKKVLRGGDA